ncbi:MAG: hypothetical protein ACLR6B_10940 [Blautia sp.]
MNTNSVIIKCNKYGLIVILDENLPFEELIKDVEDKFKESAKFFKNAKMAMTIRGRVTERRQRKSRWWRRSLTAAGFISSVSLMRIRKEELLFHQAVDKAMEEKEAEDGWFYRGTLRAGQVLETEHSIVIIGDVNPGRQCDIKGNIVDPGFSQRNGLCRSHW